VDRKEPQTLEKVGGSLFGRIVTLAGGTSPQMAGVNTAHGFS